jgi:poly-gamma-glutamate synthesis protein (capsule biosynthesis protein)
VLRILKGKYYILLSIIIVGLFGSSFFAMYSYVKKGKIEVENSVIDQNPQSKPNEDTLGAAVPVIDKIIEKKMTEVIISSVGDCTIGTDDNFYKPASLPAMVQNQSNDMSYLFKNVAEVFKNDDITTANLETTFTTSTIKKQKQFNFKGDPQLAKSLTLGFIEGVNLSNNHIYDYNQQGFDDTIKALKENNINYFGEGYKWLTTAKSMKFAFLGYQGWGYDTKYLENLKNDIQSLKAQNYIVIINFHWGEESQYTPNSVQKYLAHYSVDNGADLIIGHHPHVIQGIEKYKDRYICYSLANFCFGGNSNPPDKDTFIFQSSFKFTDNELSSIGVKVIPCSISSVSSKNDYSPTPLNDTNKVRFLDKLNKLSINLDKNINDEFYFIDLK